MSAAALDRAPAIPIASQTPPHDCTGSECESLAENGRGVRSAYEEKLQHVCHATGVPANILAKCHATSSLRMPEWPTTCALHSRKRVKPTTRGSALLAARLAKHIVGLGFTASGQTGSMPGPTTAGAAPISTSVPGARHLMFW